MLNAVATVEGSPQAPSEDAPGRDSSIVLEARLGRQAVKITLQYAAIRELRDAVISPGEEAFGALYGEYLGDSATIEHCAAAPETASPIGLFRTQSGGWPSVTEADCQRVQVMLPATAPRALLLVVRTLEQRPWSATLFVVDPRRPSTAEAPLLEFPFDEYLLRNGWLTDLAPPLPPEPRIGASLHRRRRFPWIGVGALSILIAGGIAAYQFRHSSRSTPAPSPTPAEAPKPVSTKIDLTVTRHLDQLEISWNRSAPVVLASTAATLTIRNGAVMRVVPVESDQLREGRILYRPISGVDSDFRLEILTAEGGIESESVQVVGFDTTPAMSLAAPPPAPVGQPPSQAPHVASRAVPTAPAPEPVAPITVRGEPVPIRRVNPKITREVTAEMAKTKPPVTVSVLAGIDASGVVQTAKVVSSTGEPSPSGPYIRLAALNAARQWRFKPADSGGKAVPSVVTLVFKF